MFLSWPAGGYSEIRELLEKAIGPESGEWEALFFPEEEILGVGIVNFEKYEKELFTVHLTHGTMKLPESRIVSDLRFFDILGPLEFPLTVRIPFASARACVLSAQNFQNNTRESHRWEGLL